MLRILVEEQGVQCIGCFIGANIDTNNKKRILLHSVANLDGKEHSPMLYGIEFNMERNALAAFKELFKTGRLDLYEFKNSIVRKGDCSVDNWKD